MDEKAKNIVWSESKVIPELREKSLGQKGCVIWLTGLSGSGKSTIALELEKRLFEKGRKTYILDGDNIRHGLCADLGFSDSDREENIRRISEVAALFADAGIIVIVSFISPFEKDREKARGLLPEGSFFEVFVNTSLEECEKRDPKGFYKKARNGEIKNFTGLDSPYELPENPELVLDAEKTQPGESACIIIETLEKKGIFKV